LHDGVHDPSLIRASGARALLLDALGTLVALEPPAPRLREQLAACFGVQVTLAQAERAIAAEIAFYRAHLDAAKDEESLAELRDQCARVLRAALPASSGLSGIPPASMVAVLLGSLEFTEFEDVRPALRAARDRGCRLVVVSNWDVSLHQVLERLDLVGLVDGVVTSAEVGERKPAPAIFHRALELAGVAASDALHVGDSLEEDVAGARAAGIEPILLTRGRPPGSAGVRVIASLLELGAGP
jgi:putative hydrolase of the HAD superfamily